MKTIELFKKRYAKIWDRPDKIKYFKPIDAYIFGIIKEKENTLKIIESKHIYTKGCNCELCEIIKGIKKQSKEKNEN